MRSARRRAAAVLGVLLLSGLSLYVTVWLATTHQTPTVPVDSSAARLQQPATSVTPHASASPHASTNPPVPPASPAHTDSVTAESNGRLVDTYLLFLAVLSSHRGRGAMNASGGLGHDPHHTTAPSHAEP